MARDIPLILLADDEPDVIAVYKVKLERSGFQVIVAPNGAEAVVMAAAQKPDLVLMDMKMPVMDGITAQQKIKIIRTQKISAWCFLRHSAIP